MRCLDTLLRTVAIQPLQTLVPEADDHGTVYRVSICDTIASVPAAPPSRGSAQRRGRQVSSLNSWFPSSNGLPPPTRANAYQAEANRALLAGESAWTSLDGLAEAAEQIAGLWSDHADAYAGRQYAASTSTWVSPRLAAPTPIDSC